MMYISATLASLVHYVTDLVKMAAPTAVFKTFKHQFWANLTIIDGTKNQKKKTHQPNKNNNNRKPAVIVIFIPFLLIGPLNRACDLLCLASPLKFKWRQLDYTWLLSTYVG